MKSLFWILIITVFSHCTLAQNNTEHEKLESEINRTIWKPFKQTYETRDWEGFNALHTDDVLRVHDEGIMVGAEYKNSIKESYQRYRNRNVTIDFAMERRQYTENVGYEVGFYRVIYEEADKLTRTSYGRFHVVLKKVSNKWKIAQDWDSSYVAGEPITSEDFESGEILNLSD